MKPSKDPSHIKGATSRPERVCTILRGEGGGGAGGGGGGGGGQGVKVAQTAADFKVGNQPSKVINDRGTTMMKKKEERVDSPSGGCAGVK